VEKSITPLPLGAGLFLRPGAANPASATTVSARYELMALSLNGHDYGIDVRCVVDVRDAPVPVQRFNRPACLTGSLWIAGEHAPVIDLRLAMGLPAPRTAQTAVVAIDVGDRVIGAVVDAVGGLVALPLESVTAANGPLGAVEARYLRGLGQLGTKPMGLLDIVEWMVELNEMFEITSR
jgi:purine-binding chemotaxis protein CheW